MTEQQYRVTVPGEFSAEDVATALDPFTRVRVDRIERPVPTTDAEHGCAWGLPRSECAACHPERTVPAPHPPSREQIALFLARFEGYAYTSAEGMPDWRLNQAGAVLALIQNGAAR